MFLFCGCRNPVSDSGEFGVLTLLVCVEAQDGEVLW